LCKENAVFTFFIITDLDLSDFNNKRFDGRENENVGIVLATIEIPIMYDRPSSIQVNILDIINIGSPRKLGNTVSQSVVT
jgi:hypothetical protein